LLCFEVLFVYQTCEKELFSCSFEQSNRLKQFTVDTRKEIGGEMNVDVVYASAY